MSIDSEAKKHIVMSVRSKAKKAYCMALILIPLACISFLAIYDFSLTGFANPERALLLRSSDFDPNGSGERSATSSDSDLPTSTLVPKTSASAGVVYEPSCIGEVVVSLRREGNNNDEPCEGILIRDDIILTSRSCVEPRVNFTFSVRRGNESYAETAFPHRALNSNGIVDPKLGFLAANPPYHYQFADQPVRRNRVFLSLNDTSRFGTRVAMSCFRERPIIHNFPVNGELISLGHLHQVLPDVLWEHRDVDSTPGYIVDGQRWWSHRVTMQEEKQIMLTLFEKYRGPPGSIDIVSAHDDYLDQAAAVLEPLDPRGHRSFYCYRNYYYRYRGEPPFSGEMFFDWLDFGSGKNILSRHELRKRLHEMKGDKSCYKKSFNREVLYHMNDTGRLQHEVKFEMAHDGNSVIARYRHSGEPVPINRLAKKPYLYVWDLNETFYVVDDKLFEERFGGSFKHTSILASMPALSAGELYVGGNGTVFGVNFLLGHYRPSIGQTALMYRSFQNLGINPTALYWVGLPEWSTDDCVTHDWISMNVSGYHAKLLNHSCHEVTKSRTWIRVGKAHRLFKKHLELISEERSFTDSHPG